MPIKLNWRIPAMLLSGISLLTACSPRPLKVVAAEPLPPPKVAVPQFLQTCPPTPSWYPPTMCRPAPAQPHTP